MIENSWDFIDKVSQRDLQATRCLNCGAVDDFVILANRQRSRRAGIIAPRGLAGKKKLPASQRRRM
jgi:hypothetical protein